MKILVQKRIETINLELEAARINDTNFQTRSCIDVISERQNFCANCYLLTPESNHDPTELCSFVDCRLHDHNFYLLDMKESPTFYDAFFNHAKIKGRKNINREISVYILTEIYF